MDSQQANLDIAVPCPCPSRCCHRAGCRGTEQGNCAGEWGPCTQRSWNDRSSAARSWWSLLISLWALSIGNSVFIPCYTLELSITTLSLHNSSKTPSWWFLHKYRVSRKKSRCETWGKMLTVGTAVLCKNTCHLVWRSRMVTVPSLRPIIAGQGRKNMQEFCVITTFKMPL